MQAVIRDDMRESTVLSSIPLVSGAGWGLLGGLVATLIMDAILMISLAAAGQPPLGCYSIVGDTMRDLLSLHGVGNSIPLGVAAHYLIGPLMGAVYGAVGATLRVLRVDSLKKAVVRAVLYAEIFSQPMLVLPPILLHMPASSTLLWLGGAFVMHMIWGCVLGVVLSRGLRLQITGIG